MAKKKKDPLAAAAQQVVKKTTDKVVKQTTQKRTAEQKVRSAAKGVAGNIVKNKAPGTVKKNTANKSFKASNISGNTGRSIKKRDRDKTAKTYATMNQAKRIARSNVTATQKGEKVMGGNAVQRNVLQKNKPTRLSRMDDFMLTDRGKNEVNNAKALYEVARRNNDEAGMKLAHGMAELARLNNQTRRRNDSGDIVGPYSGGTWGDRYIEANMGNFNTGQTGLIEPEKNFLRSEAYQVKSALNEAGAGYLNTLREFPLRLPEGQGSSQLMIKGSDQDKYSSNVVDRRGQSRYTEEDMANKALEFQAASDAQRELGYQTTPVNGFAGQFIGDATRVATGIGLDAAANAVVPGAGLVNMGARTWGTQVKQAKDEQKLRGTDKEPFADLKAYMYGTAMTGVEVATEKMFDGVKVFGKSVYGAGGATTKLGKMMDDVFNVGINRAVARLAKTPGGEAAISALMNIGKSGLEEGLEELVADFVQWQMPKIYGGDVEGAKEMLTGALYDFALGAAMGGFGGVTSTGSSMREAYLDRTNRNAEAISDRMSNLGADKEQAKTALSRMTIYQLESLAEASDETLTNVGKEMGLISSQNANQSLTEASEEQRSEQTVDDGQPAVSRSKAKDALRKRLRSMDIRDADRLRGIMDGLSAQEMDTASKMSAEDLSAWVDGRESGEITPAEQATVVEDVEEEEDEFAITPGDIRALGNKLERLGVKGPEIARAVSDDATIEQLINMDEEELLAWAQEQMTPAQPEALAEQTELLEAQRQERQEEAQAPATPLERSASVLGAAGRTAFISSYNPSKRSDLYTAEAYRAYNAGFTGNVRPTMYKTLNRASSEALYQAGVIDRQSSMRARENKKRNAIVFDKNTSELYWDENVERTIAAYSQAEGVRRFTQKDAQHLDRIVRALGKKAFFVESIDSLTEPGKHDIANGSYADGILKISLKTVDPISFTFGHEITHAMAEMSPKEYKRLERYVMGLEQSESQLAAIRKAYEDLKLPLSQETAIEEVVADYVGQMVTDLDLLERFARQVDRNVLQKFFDALRSLARKLTGKDKEDVNKAVKLVENMLKSSVKQNKRMPKRGQSNTATGERFSIKNPTEASGNLVALHNLTEDKLLKSIENGGFPMPSIAVTRADVEHSNFGDITLLMGRDTVDPETDKRNRVYSADVWSPTFPQYEYEPNEKVEKRLRDKFYELSNKHGRDVAEPLYAYGVTLEDTLNRVGGYEGIISREKDNTNMKKTFLADKGRPVPGDVYKTKTNRIPQERINEANAFVENFGESNIEDAMSTRGSIRDLRKYFDENRDAIEDAFRRTWLQMSPDLSEQDASDAAKEVKMPNFRTMLLIISRIREGNIETQSQEYDSSASRKAVDDAVDQEEYEAWLEDLFKGVEKRRGIYNGKDFYTPSGNRRSFSQTHFEVTLENIVRAMQSQNEKNTAGFHGSKTVRAASAKSFKNVAQMHEDEGRLQNRTPEEAERLTAEMDSRLSDIINRIYGLKKHSSYDNPFIEFDSIGEIILEVAETGRFTPSNVKNIFGGYEYDLPKDISEDIVQLIKDIQEMPVNIFEAKPQRVVGLDEIVTAIIPDDASDKVVNALEENSIPIERYSSGNNASRMQVVNNAADSTNVKFSVRGTGYQPSSQRDADYMDAVQDGDMDTAQRMVDEAAKEAGYTIKAYHGTANGGKFTIFDPKKLNNSKMSSHIGQGFYFTNSREGAQEYTKNMDAYGKVTKGSNPNLFEGYIRLQNPIEITNNSHVLTLKQIRNIVSDGNKKWFFESGIAHELQNKDIGGESYTKDEIKAMDIEKRIDLYSRYLYRFGDMAALSNMVDAYTFDSQDALLLSIQYHTGYDGIHWEQKEGLDQFVVFDSSQFKDSSPVTYDDNGNIIPLSERFDPSKPDIRWSIRGGLTYDQMVERYGSIKPGERRARNVAVPKQTSDNTKVHQTIRTIMEAGRTPEELLPTIEEMIESGEFSYEVFGNREAVRQAQQELEENGWDDTYKRWSNDIDKGIVSASNTAMGWVLYDTALQEAREATGPNRWDTVARIVFQMTKHQRNAAQALQATRILKLFPPEMQLAVMGGKKPKHVQDKLDRRKAQEQEEEDYDDDIDLPDSFFGEEEEEDETGAPRQPKPKKPRKKRQTDEDGEGDRITQKDVEDTAEFQAQTAKVTFYDKWNAWRYMAMLANFRTHIRNIFGNLGFAPIIMSKNLTATAAEIAVYYTIGKHAGMKRTKGFYNPQAFAYAWKDFAEMRPVILNDPKYERQDMELDKVFGGLFGKPLEAVRKFNSAMLDKEDAWFSRPQYANALAQYMGANGITVEMMETGTGEITRGPHKGEHITQAIMDEARAYAVLEAQKATYRDLNDFSRMMTNLGKARDDSRFERTKDILVNGILPFKKTPANILVRAVEYSPVGFANGLKKLIFDVPRTARIQKKIEEGKELTERELRFKQVTVAEALDSIAAGMSGTALFRAGMLLAQLGLLVAKTDDGDDEQKYFNRLLGKQQWAIEYHDMSITVDWLAPEVIPMFMGAQFFREMEAGSNGVKTVTRMLDAMSGVLDPVLELSCLSGVQQALDDAASFADGDLNTMMAMIGSMGLSYFTQAIPTLAGQLERVSQAERMTTFTSKDPDELLSTDMQYLLGKISAKVPGWDFRQIPYVDSWGQTETETSLFKRIVANMFNPAYVKKIDTRDVNKELQRLYDATGDGSVLPEPGWKQYNYSDENGVNHTVYLSAEEYVAYGRAKGRNQFEMVSQFINSATYKNLTDAVRADVLREIYNYSEYKAQKEYIHDFKGKAKGYKIDDYEEFAGQYGNLISFTDYIVLDTQLDDVKGLKSANYKNGQKTIMYTKSDNLIISIHNSGIKIPTDQQEYEAFMSAFGVADSQKGWSKSMAEADLAKQKKKYGITE